MTANMKWLCLSLRKFSFSEGRSKSSLDAPIRPCQWCQNGSRQPHGNLRTNWLSIESLGLSRPASVLVALSNNTYKQIKNCWGQDPMGITHVSVCDGVSASNPQKPQQLQASPCDQAVTARCISGPRRIVLQPAVNRCCCTAIHMMALVILCWINNAETT